MKPALLLTGASSVIGRALIRRLAEDGTWSGCRWVLTGRDARNLESQVSDLRRASLAAEAVVLDMTDEAGCRAFFSALPGLGPFKGMALVAGINHDTSTTKLEVEAWERVYRINAGFHAELIRRAEWAPTARVLLVGSQVGLRGSAGQVAYGAAKGALVDLMRSAPAGLRINTLLPPLVDSPLLDNLSDASRAGLYSTRLMEDPDAAASCAEAGNYLLSDESSYVHRMVLHADSRVSSMGWDE